MLKVNINPLVTTMPVAASLVLLTGLSYADPAQAMSVIVRCDQDRSSLQSAVDQAAPGTVLNVFGTCSRTVINGKDDLEIRGLHSVTSPSTTGISGALRITDSTHLNIYDLVFSGLETGNTVTIQDSSSISLATSTLTRTAIRIRRSTDVVLSDLAIEAQGLFAGKNLISTTGTISGLRIVGANLRNAAGNGIQIKSDSGEAAATIDGVVLENIQGLPLLIERGVGTRVENSLFADSGTVIEIRADAVDSVISANAFYGSQIIDNGSSSILSDNVLGSEGSSGLIINDFGYTQAVSDPLDCQEALEDGHSTSGVYRIQLGGNEVRAFCDMQSRGGGWTVLMRRSGSDVAFDRNWADYRDGFGALTASFWWGLENMHQLTTSADYELLVPARRILSLFREAQYGSFSVGDEPSNYQLSVSSFMPQPASGPVDLGDSLGSHNGNSFSTRDRDNSGRTDDCLDSFSGGWWFRGPMSFFCYLTYLTGPYQEDGGPLVPPDNDGIQWLTAHSTVESLLGVSLLVRRVTEAP